jgi:NAD(P)-dependent dehydrogenase (short-subunit alcohol dehydrogenase family)
MDFPRLHQPLRAVVVGANGGIGHALCEALAESTQVAQVYAFSRQLPRVDHPKICGGVLELADDEGMSQSAIAEHLQIPLGTVKTRSRQGLLALRGHLLDFSASALDALTLPPSAADRHGRR